MFVWTLLAQAAGGEGIVGDGPRFILMLVLQGGSLVILAYLGLKTLPDMLDKLIQMRTQDHDRFDARSKELKEEIRHLHEESVKVIHRCLTLMADLKAETNESINQLHQRLPKRPGEE